MSEVCIALVGSDFEISRTCEKYRGHYELTRTCKIASVAPRDADTPEAVSLRSECSGFILQDQIVKLYKTDFEGDTSCDFCHHSELARTKFVLAISILFQEHTVGVKNKRPPHGDLVRSRPSAQSCFGGPENYL